MSLIEPNFFEALPPRVRLAIIAVGLGLVLALVGLGFYACSGTGVPTGKGANLLVNEGISQGRNAVEANLIANQEKEVNNAENVANQANANLANSLKRDSNVYSGSQSDADDAFCSRYPTDSSCAAWRLRHHR